MLSGRGGIQLCLLLPLLLAGCSAMQNATLEGTKWRWVSIEHTDGRWESAIPGERSYPFVTFRPDTSTGGKLVGYGGCNRVTALYRRDDRQLSLSSLRTTRLSCGMTTDGAEARFTHTLATAHSFEIEGTQLRIRSDGATIHFTITEPFAADSVFTFPDTGRPGP